MAAPEAEDFETEEAPPKPPDKTKVERSKHYLSCQIDNLEKQLVSKFICTGVINIYLLVIMAKTFEAVASLLLYI